MKENTRSSNKESRRSNKWRGKIPKAYPKKSINICTLANKKEAYSNFPERGGEGSAKQKEEACTRCILKVATLKWPMN